MSLPDWNDADWQAAKPLLDYWIAIYNLPADLIYGQASEESRFKPRAYRYEVKIDDASRGIMQVLYRTAQALGYDGAPEGLFDPSKSIELGCKLMAQNLARFGNIFDALSAYNAGRIGTIEGSAYARRVLVRAEYFASLAANTQPVDSANQGPPTSDPISTAPGDGPSVLPFVALVIGAGVIVAVLGMLRR